MTIVKQETKPVPCAKCAELEASRDYWYRIATENGDLFNEADSKFNIAQKRLAEAERQRDEFKEARQQQLGRVQTLGRDLDNMKALLKQCEEVIGDAVTGSLYGLTTRMCEVLSAIKGRTTE